MSLNNQKGNILVWVLLISALFFVFFIDNGESSVCESPVKYSIGNVDSQYSIASINGGLSVSRNDFLSAILEAEKIWEDGIGLNLFEYKQDASLKINLIFSEEQREFIEANKASENLDRIESSLDSVNNKYESSSYAYDKRVSLYKKRLSSYNSQVDYWNARGGAPKEIYNQLEEERIALQVLYDNIDVDASRVNNIAQEFNNLSNKYNFKADTYNNDFAGEEESTKGTYDGVHIDINQFDNKKDLVLVLAHELGHSLGLDHVVNQESIMYYLMENQDLTKPQLTQNDIQALKNECNLN